MPLACSFCSYLFAYVELRCRMLVSRIASPVAPSWTSWHLASQGGSACSFAAWYLWTGARFSHPIKFSGENWWCPRKIKSRKMKVGAREFHDGMMRAHFFYFFSFFLDMRLWKETTIHQSWEIFGQIALFYHFRLWNGNSTDSPSLFYLSVYWFNWCTILSVCWPICLLCIIISQGPWI